jgi:hypothetical protein
MHYTYIHRRESDNAVFYVGKGKDRRAWSCNRGQHWKNTVAKHGLKVEVCAEWPTEAEAFEHEKFLILCFKDMGCKLINQTDGGEGASGRAMSEAHKAIISASHKGKAKSEQAREKIRQALNSPEVKARRIVSLTIAANRPDVKDKRAASARVSHARPETQAKLSAAGKEINARPDVKAKIAAASKAYSNRPEVKARVSAWAKEHNARPEIKAAKSGANAPGARPVLCSNGMYFVTMAAAVEWLRSIGHTKAASANLHTPLRNPKATAYGFHWQYAETNESLKKEMA